MYLSMYVSKLLVKIFWDFFKLSRNDMAQISRASQGPPVGFKGSLGSAGCEG